MEINYVPSCWCVCVRVQCAPPLLTIREIVQTSNNNRVLGTNGQAVCVVFGGYCAHSKRWCMREASARTGSTDKANRTKNRTGVLSKNKRWSKQAIIFHFDQSTWWQTNEPVAEHQGRASLDKETGRERERAKKWWIGWVTARNLCHLNGKKYFAPKKYSFFCWVSWSPVPAVRSYCSCACNAIATNSLVGRWLRACCIDIVRDFSFHAQTCLSRQDSSSAALSEQTSTTTVLHLPERIAMRLTVHISDVFEHERKHHH